MCRCTPATFDSPAELCDTCEQALYQLEEDTEFVERQEEISKVTFVEVA